MHILGFLLAVVAAVGVWYWRARRTSEIADEVFDAAGHVRGAYRRRKFRQKVEGSVLTSVDNPGLAAAIILVSLGEGAQGWSVAKEEEIASWLRDEVQYPDVKEAISYGRWVVREVVDPNEIVRKLMPVWQTQLGPAQKHELLVAANRISAMEGGPDHAQTDALRRLKEGLMN